MYDILIKNGMVIDGKGGTMYRSDIGIQGDKIHAIGDLGNASSGKLIDASGKYVCPGFIDITNHSDTHWTLFSIPTQESLVRQGITTILGGACGTSLAPLVKSSGISAIQKWTNTSEININWLSMEDFLSETERHPIAVNFATLVGHGTLRRDILGDKNIPAEGEDLSQMSLLLKRALDEGAFGISFGLTFSHGRPASDEEIMTLARIVAADKGICAIHLRDEGKNLLPSLSEAIRIARDTGVSVEISHFKALGKEAWNDLPRALHLIREAREDNLPITVDVFPYDRTGSLLYVLLPPWARDGGKDAILRRLEDSSQRRLILAELERLTMHFDRIIIASAAREKSTIGKSLTQIADNLSISPAEAMLYILTTNELAVTILGETIQTQDVSTILEEPYCHVSTDGFGLNTAISLTKDLTHPRSFGATAKLLGTYVRDQKVLSWESAIRKLTGGPAEKIGLKMRGILAPKHYADVVIVDPEHVQDVATFTNPFQYPSGIPWVIINGSIIVENQVFNPDIASGIVIRKL